ncbi:MAG: antitoxin VapB family protein [Candidatus Lokiarchaeota archaeon]|nr:antitoxin VapB family protein [Candidatus Harpocratesius repetitus]
MSSINISITKEIYYKLKRLKRPNESFSKLINRLLENKKDPFEYLGIWEKKIEGDEEDEGRIFEEAIIKARKIDKQKNEYIINL